VLLLIDEPLRQCYQHPFLVSGVGTRLLNKVRADSTTLFMYLYLIYAPSPNYPFLHDAACESPMPSTCGGTFQYQYSLAVQYVVSMRRSGRPAGLQGRCSKVHFSRAGAEALSSRPFRGRRGVFQVDMMISSGARIGCGCPWRHIKHPQNCPSIAKKSEQRKNNIR
jgi:hypothetical protein